MKRFVILIILIMSFIIINMAFTDKILTYTISLFVGDVHVSHNSGQNWATVLPDMELKEADTIKTGADSFCDILMPGRGNFRIVDNTIVSINKLKKQVEEIKVKKGKVLFTISTKLKGDESFKVESDVAVAAVRGTEFVVETDGNKLKYSVIKGRVAIRRNVNIPVEDRDSELAKSLEVEASDNQEIELTMDENKALEATLERAKNDMAELKSILAGAKKDDQKKIKLIKNANRVIEELNKYEELTNNETNDQSEDDTGKLIEKIKEKGK